jgi:hypothetical protein
MKINRPLLTLAICLGLIAVAVIIKVWLPAMHTEQNTVPTSSMNDSNVKTNAERNAASNGGGFFKTITDAQAGQYAIVNSNKTSVALMDKSGRVIWSTNVVEKIPPDALQHWGSEISSMKIINGELIIDVGFASFSVDVKTGKTTFLGAD